ncbi:hypothetical protein NHQ30_009649 [Ciborinia camelliae]|nr:hypothetical protein NHQ30_009649 [Ciborinia camelliae]
MSHIIMADQESGGCQDPGLVGFSCRPEGPNRQRNLRRLHWPPYKAPMDSKFRGQENDMGMG